MFSKSCKYAIRAVLLLATESSEKEKLCVDQLAKQLNIPREFLAKVLQVLTKQKCISSSRGRNGGFYLSEENLQGNLLSVIQAIDGPGFFEECILGLPECSGNHPCPYHHVIKDHRKTFLSLLENETIIESAKRIKASPFGLKI